MKAIKSRVGEEVDYELCLVWFWWGIDGGVRLGDDGVKGRFKGGYVFFPVYE
jgi:hypothetical protein